MTLSGVGALAAALVLIQVTSPASPALPQPPTSRPTLTVTEGRLEGLVVDGAPDVRAFLGVPYAAAPTGSNRWRAPGPALPWPGTRDAREFGPACIQSGDALLGSAGLERSSEDCLTLNVWTATQPGRDRLPVMVWIHGGGYLQGASSQRVYDGASLARRGVVVVTLNYRLGPLGFLAHPELSAEAEARTSGNYALLDQIEALRWVRRNIARFGGDPGRVTLSGQSSGAGCVNALLVAPLAQGLFHRAILQSGSLLGPIQHLRDPWYSLTPAETVGTRVAKELGAEGEGGLRRLREATPERLIAAARPQLPFTLAGNRFAPIVDGVVVPGEPAVLLERGEFKKVPVLVGANADEGSVFARVFDGFTLFGYRQVLAFAYGNHAEAVFKQYPAEDDEGARRALTVSLGHAAFVAPARRLAASVSKAGGRAWLYHFSRANAGESGRRFGAFHGAEVPYVFATLRPLQAPFLGAVEVAERDRLLSEEMASAWVRFAATGDPNGEGLTSWPAYDSSDDALLEFGETTTVRRRLQADVCDLFDVIARRKGSG